MFLGFVDERVFKEKQGNHILKFSPNYKNTDRIASRLIFHQFCIQSLDYLTHDFSAGFYVQVCRQVNTGIILHFIYLLILHLYVDINTGTELSELYKLQEHQVSLCSVSMSHSDAHHSLLTSTKYSLIAPIKNNVKFLLNIPLESILTQFVGWRWRSSSPQRLPVH